MAKIETTNEITVPTNKIKVEEKSKLLPSNRNLTTFKRLAPNMVGIPRKKENSVATKREPPMSIAPKMVAPDREVPGIKDKT